MFDLGWGKIVLIGIVALIVIGPKELPGALRTLGQWMTKLRRMASEFQNQFHEAMREAELADLKKDVDEMAAKAQSYTNFDPIDDLRKDIESAAAPPSDLESPLSPANTVASSLTSASDVAAPVSGHDAPASAGPEGAVAHAPSEPLAAVSTPESTPDASKPDAGRAA
jgi:sec-independent protein translocase protein TatB